MPLIDIIILSSTRSMFNTPHFPFHGLAAPPACLRRRLTAVSKPRLPFPMLCMWRRSLCAPCPCYTHTYTQELAYHHSCMHVPILPSTSRDTLSAGNRPAIQRPFLHECTPCFLPPRHLAFNAFHDLPACSRCPYLCFCSALPVLYPMLHGFCPLLVHASPAIAP